MLVVASCRVAALNWPFVAGQSGNNDGSTEARHPQGHVGPTTSLGRLASIGSRGNRLHVPCLAVFIAVASCSGRMPASSLAAYGAATPKSRVTAERSQPARNPSSPLLDCQVPSTGVGDTCRLTSEDGVDISIRDEADHAVFARVKAASLEVVLGARGIGVIARTSGESDASTGGMSPALCLQGYVVAEDLPLFVAQRARLGGVFEPSDAVRWAGTTNGGVRVTYQAQSEWLTSKSLHAVIPCAALSLAHETTRLRYDAFQRLVNAAENTVRVVGDKPLPLSAEPGAPAVAWLSSRFPNRLAIIRRSGDQALVEACVAEGCFSAWTPGRQLTPMKTDTYSFRALPVRPSTVITVATPAKGPTRQLLTCSEAVPILLESEGRFKQVGMLSSEAVVLEGRDGGESALLVAPMYWSPSTIQVARPLWVDRSNRRCRLRAIGAGVE